jgi:transcriptional regulator with XRE-family HTH domain
VVGQAQSEAPAYIFTAPVDSQRAVRIARAFSQAELGERSGVSRVAITRLEHGDIDARFATIRRLAEALNVEPSDLMAAPEETTA